MPRPLPSDSDDESFEQGGIRWREIFRLRRLVFLVPLVGVALGVAGYGHYTDPGPLESAETVIVPHGSAKQVTATLQNKGLIAPGWISHAFFRGALILTSREGPIHAAEFVFPPRVSVAHLLDILRHGQAVQHAFTLPEGLTARRIAQLLAQAPGLTGALPEFAEGSVAPQTYAYTWGTPRVQLLHRMQKKMNATLEQVWKTRDRAALENTITTPEQLLTLAALIERETSVPDERPKVARVFLNRLQTGMKLQTDPTVIYALSDGWGTLDPPLSHEDLSTISPYNTYLVKGLPPGPICSPGLASLEAAAHPVAGDMLYFVATGRGGHNFSRTLAEQNEHIRAYHDALTP